MSSLWDKLTEIRYSVQLQYAPRVTLAAVTFGFTLADLLIIPQPSKNDTVDEANKFNSSFGITLIRTLIFAGVWGYYLKYTYPSLKNKPLQTIEKIGFSMAVLGGLLRNYSKYVLGKHFTYTLSHQPDHKVVDCFPYSIVRHPGYTAFVLNTTGNCLWLKNPIYALMSIKWNIWAVKRINHEEQFLIDNIGDNYKQYQNNVKYKLFPYLF
eukprot:300508_1